MVNCLKCTYLKINQNEIAFPYYCIFFNFKSKLYPSITVAESLGKDCLYFNLSNHQNNQANQEEIIAIKNQHKGLKFDQNI